MVYRVSCQLLTMTDQLNLSYYSIKQDPPNLNTLKHTHICPIYLYDWTLNDFAYCHNKTHLTEQSVSVAGNTLCILRFLNFMDHVSMIFQHCIIITRKGDDNFCCFWTSRAMVFFGVIKIHLKHIVTILVTDSS